MSEETTVNADDHARALHDRMTRGYLLSVLDNGIIEEHCMKPTGHHSEPLSRLLAWCWRRPLAEQYSVKQEATGEFRIIRMSGRRGHPPTYVTEEAFSTVEAARHGVLLRHIKDLTGK